MKLKWLFLFGLIAFPVCFYLFLQAFGENHFEIPMFYQNGVENEFAACDSVTTNAQYYAKPFYEVDSAVLPVEKNKLVVYELGILQSSGGDVKNNLLSFLNKFQENENVSFLSLATNKINAGALKGYRGATFRTCSHDDLLEYGRCILRMDLTFDSLSSEFNGSKLVLCDQKRRIRGYYDPSELKEIDRLNTELYILLNK